MINQRPGYVRIGSFNEIPVLLHWSFPLAGICIALFFHAKRTEVLFVCVAYAALIFLHEIGHALAARLFGMKVFSIELTGVGGTCLTELPSSRLAAFIHASAGLIVQIVLLASVFSYIHYYGEPTNVATSSFAFVFTVINSLLILVNLIPDKTRGKNHGNDGYILWKLMIQFFRRHPYVYPDASVIISPEESLLHKNGFVPPGFKVGIEIFNDNRTTMEFVVEALVRHLKVPRDKAIEMMISIHKSGGLVIPLDSYELAQKASNAINGDAKRERFDLVCRPVDVQKPHRER